MQAALGTEITTPLTLSNRQKQLLACHTVLNLLQVLECELRHLEQYSGFPQSFASTIQACNQLNTTLIQQLQDSEVQNPQEFALLWKSHDLYHALESDLKHMQQEFPEFASVARASRNELNPLLSYLKLRWEETAQELFSSHYHWSHHHPGSIKDTLNYILCAMAQYSHGRYGIAFNKAAQHKNDYRITALIPDDGDNNNTPMYLPDIFESLIIDLIANARKYTASGGRITLRLREEEDTIQLRVSDNGRGIAPHEIEQVVQFGFRGSNASTRRGFSGGFGLTRAYLVCRELGGRFWIDSALEEGTTFVLQIPKPPSP